MAKNINLLTAESKIIEYEQYFYECDGNIVYDSNISHLYLIHGDYTKAKTYVDREYDKGLPEYRKIELFRADYYATIGEYDRALQIYNKILDDYPGWKFGIYHKGLFYIYNSEYKKARTILEQLLDTDPKYPYANAGMAVVSYELGEYDNSIYYMNEATTAWGKALSHSRGMYSAIQSAIKLKRYDVALHSLNLMYKKDKTYKNDPIFVDITKRLYAAMNKDGLVKKKTK